MTDKNVAVDELAELIEHFRNNGSVEKRREHLRELARQQGVKPLESIKELEGDFWPENESVDDFLEIVCSIRHQDQNSKRTDELLNGE